MYPYFSFKASGQHTTFYARGKEIIYGYLFLFPVAIAVALLVWVINPYFSITLPELLFYISFFIVCAGVTAAFSLYKVRNYIIALKYEDDIITIDYMHYNTLTRYTGALPDFEISVKKTYGKNRYNNSNYLRIKLLKHNLVIKQTEVLEWSNSKMNDFISCVQQQF